MIKDLVDKNPKDNEGCTPLHCAAQEGHLEVAEYIAGQIEDKNPVDESGDTPLSVATENGHLEIANYFEKVIHKRRRITDGRNGSRKN